MRIESVPVPLSHHLLEDHRHLLRMVAFPDELPIGPSSFEEGGGVDQLDRFQQPLEPGCQLRLVVGDHLGFVYTCEWAAQSVFQEARGPNRHWCVDLLHESTEIAQRFRRKVGLLERVGDPSVGLAGKGHLAKAVSIHERVEHVRAQHGETRDLHPDGPGARGKGLFKRSSDGNETFGLSAEAPSPDP